MIKNKNELILVILKKFEFLKEESKVFNGINKNDLKKLGIEHDNFSETDLVEKNLVDKAINKLKKKIMLKKDFKPLKEKKIKLEKN